MKVERKSQHQIEARPLIDVHNFVSVFTPSTPMTNLYRTTPNNLFERVCRKIKTPHQRVSQPLIILRKNLQTHSHRQSWWTHKHD
jgi:hypothetical protein